MKRKGYGSLRAYAAAMAVLLALALCAGTASPPFGNAAAAGTAYTDGEARAMLDYLRAAEEDLALISELLADEDIGMLEEYTGSGEEVTREDITELLEILESYASRLDSRMETIKRRDEPNHPDVAFFVAAEMFEFETLSDIIEEYIQVLRYTETMLDMEAEMQFADMDAKDPKSMYVAVSVSITKAIGIMGSANVPSFLKNRNDGLVALLNELNDSVLYLLSAVAFNDPVLTSAGLYRLDVLLRKFEKLSDEFAKDVDDRNDKLREDALRIRDENDGLTDWVRRNIAKLGGN